MPRRGLPITAFLIALGLGAPAGAGPASLAPGRSLAEVATQLPPIPAGHARVWFLRQYEPSESPRSSR